MIQSFFLNKLPEIEELLKTNKVKNAYIFGSVTTEDFNHNSDIDLLITFKDGLDPLEYGDLYWNLLFSLEKMLNREVDLVTEKSLRNPYFIDEINETRQIIYGETA